MKKTFHTIEEIPLTLNAIEIAQVLGLSRAGAYNLLNSKGFPTLCIGSRKIVPKDKFIEWINRNSGGEIVFDENKKTESEGNVPFRRKGQATCL